MANTIAELFKQVFIRGSLLVAAIAVIGSVVGFLVAGMPGLVSALIGAGLTLLFVTLGGFFGVVLGGWVLKLVGFIVLIGALKGADFISGPVLFFTLVASILGTLAIDSVLVLKARIPIDA